MIERKGAAVRSMFLAAFLLTGCTVESDGRHQLAVDAAIDGSFDRAPPTDDGGDANFERDAAMDAASDDGGPLDAGSRDASPTEADADADVDVDEGPVGDGGYPELLSQTGLYQNIAIDMTRIDVTAFAPRFKLWSDGATKRRWLKLPAGSQIDTSNMDAWVFPVGTKAWKEFTSNGVRVETRMLHKVAADQWVMIAYRWRSDQSEADAVPAGEADALGTAHDIPDQMLCARCHNNAAAGGSTGAQKTDVLLGFSALQLSHELGGQNLTQLTSSGRLSNPPKTAFKIPGGDLAENALGYLHANCGHCHRPGTAAHAQILKRPPYKGGPILWERTDALDTLEHTVGYMSTVLQANAVLPDLHIIEPGYPDKSELVVRASQRGVGTLQMPPVGTEVADQAGLKQIRDWIQSLKH